MQRVYILPISGVRTLREGGLDCVMEVFWTEGRSGSLFSGKVKFKRL